MPPAVAEIHVQTGRVPRLKSQWRISAYDAINLVSCCGVAILYNATSIFHAAVGSMSSILVIAIALRPAMTCLQSQPGCTSVLQACDSPRQGLGNQVCAMLTGLHMPTLSGRLSIDQSAQMRTDIA